MDQIFGGGGSASADPQHDAEVQRWGKHALLSQHHGVGDMASIVNLDFDAPDAFFFASRQVFHVAGERMQEHNLSQGAFEAEGPSVYRAHLWCWIDVVHKIKALFERREPCGSVFVTAYANTVADLSNKRRLLADQPNRFVVVFHLRRIHFVFITNVKMENSSTGVVAIQSILSLLFSRQGKVRISLSAVLSAGNRSGDDHFIGRSEISLHLLSS